MHMVGQSTGCILRIVIVGGIGLRRNFGQRTPSSRVKVTLLAKGAIRNFAAFEHVTARKEVFVEPKHL